MATDTQATLDVNSILQSAPQYKSITVEKDDIKYDLGHLCAYDYMPIDNQELKHNTSYLLDLSRDNAQLLFTKIFQLPAKVATDGVLAELPKPTTVLPRAKPLPEQREPTTWEKFAKIKGIKKKSRKPQLVWDEDHQEYRRRFGYKRANNPEDQWAIPVDDNHGASTNAPQVDPFTKMRQDKKARAEKQEEKVKKNKTQAKLEKARSQASTGAKLKDDITRTFALVSRSTASLGRFDRRLPGETSAPAVKGTRKVAGVGSAVSGDSKAEKSANLAIMDKMINKEEKLNKDRAASQFMTREQNEKSKRKREELLTTGKNKKHSKK